LILLNYADSQLSILDIKKVINPNGRGASIKTVINNFFFCCICLGLEEKITKTSIIDICLFVPKKRDMFIIFFKVECSMLFYWIRVFDCGWLFKYSFL